MRSGSPPLPGDWRLEVIARNNLVDLLWQVGPIQNAAVGGAHGLRKNCEGELAALTDMDMLYANLTGILSELDLIEEASQAARGVTADAPH